MAKTTEVLVTTAAAVQLDGTSHAGLVLGRKWVLIHNYGPNPIHVAFGGPPTAGKAHRIAAANTGVPGSLGPIQIGEQPVYALADTADQTAGAGTVLAQF